MNQTPLPTGTAFVGQAQTLLIKQENKKMKRLNDDMRQKKEIGVCGL